MTTKQLLSIFERDAMKKLAKGHYQYLIENDDESKRLQWQR